MFYALIFAFITFATWIGFTKYYEPDFDSFTPLGYGFIFVSVFLSGYVGYAYDNHLDHLNPLIW